MKWWCPHSGGSGSRWKLQTIHGLLLLLQLMMRRTDHVQAIDVVTKLMSFNVRTSYAHEDRGGKCSNWDGIRKDNVVSQVRLVNPDFVGTQETSDEQKVFLDAQLADTYRSIGKNTGSLKGKAGEVDALYYRFNDWTLLTEGMFWLGPDIAAPSSDWGMQYYRACVWGRFEHQASGQTVCVFNTHWETPGNDLAQKNGARIILDKMKANCDPKDTLSVLLGDLNALRSYPAVQLVLQNGYQDPSDQGTFCGNMLDPTCGDKFDWVLFSLTGSACHLQTAPIRQSFDGCYPSDHAVLVGEFCIGGKCCGADVDVPTVKEDIPVATTAGNGSTNTSADANQTSNEAARSNPPAMPAPTASNSKNQSNVSANTKSAKQTNKTGTVLLVILGCFVGAGVVFVVVMRQKRVLQARAQHCKTSDTCNGFNGSSDSSGSSGPSDCSSSCGFTGSNALMSLPSPPRSYQPSNLSSPTAILGDCQTFEDDWKLDRLARESRVSSVYR